MHANTLRLSPSGIVRARKSIIFIETVMHAIGKSVQPTADDRELDQLLDVLRLAIDGAEVLPDDIAPPNRPQLRLVK